MKKLLPFVCIALFALSFVSCNKCTTCSYDYNYGAGPQTYTSEEYCGSRSDVKEFEDANKELSERAGGTNFRCE